MKMTMMMKTHTMAAMPPGLRGLDLCAAPWDDEGWAEVVVVVAVEIVVLGVEIVVLALVDVVCIGVPVAVESVVLVSEVLAVVFVVGAVDGEETVASTGVVASVSLVD